MPASIAIAVVMPVTATGVGLVGYGVCGKGGASTTNGSPGCGTTPVWPAWFCPQQKTSPVPFRAHEKNDPAVISTIPVRPGTFTGLALSTAPGPRPS